MITLETLKGADGARKKSKRLGRGAGSKKGDTSGKGHKGLKARKGKGPRPGFEGGQTPLYRRIPKRGFRNAPFRKQYITINVSELENISAEAVDLVSLKKAKVVKGKETLLKILGNGDLTKAVHVRAHKFTESAKQKIEKAGGKVELLKLNITKETESK